MNAKIPAFLTAAACGAALLAVAPVKAGEPPPTNRLQGVAVFKEDGRPAVGLQVVMVSRAKGYIYFTDVGLQGAGEDEKVLWYFTKRNSKQSCSTTTDRDGRFSFENFAAPDEPWIVAAGDPEHGYALETGVRPRDFAHRPLKIEIEKAAFIKATPPEPPEKSLRVYVAATLAPPPSAPAGAAGGYGEDDESATDRIYVYNSRSSFDTGKKPVKIGPVPAGHSFLVTAYVSGAQVPYQAKIFERAVKPEPGETAEVSLESTEGAALSGTITNSKDEPLANVNVTVKAADGLVIGTLTDDEGKYELSGLPSGTHMLELLRHAKRLTPG